MTRTEALRRLLTEMDVDEIEEWMGEAEADNYDGRLLEICALFKGVSDSIVSSDPGWLDQIKSMIAHRGTRDKTDRAYLKLVEQGVDTEALREVVREMQMRVVWKLVSGIHDGAGVSPVKDIPNIWIGFCCGTHDDNFNQNDDVAVLPRSLHPIVDDLVKST